MDDPGHVGLPEHGEREEDLAPLEEAAGIPRERLALALEPLVVVQAAWTPGRVVLKAGRYVGTVQIGRLRVDVSPSLAAAEMATLIRYAFGGVVEGWQHSRIATSRTGLDELIAAVFAEELSVLREAGLSRNYVSRRELLPVLRGRPDFVASFPWNDGSMTSIACRYHELTCDNLDNQLLRAAVERTMLMDTSVMTRRRLLEHRQAWSEIASLRAVVREEFTTARERYTRLSEHYRLAHNLAELILLGHRPSSPYEAGRQPTGGLCLDMADLFERFGERSVRETLEPLGLVVRSQEADRGALLDRDGHRYRRIRPDLVIYREGLPIAVVDAKYKEYWPAAADGCPAHRVSNEDLYQLFFYAQRLQLRHRLASAPAAFILAPLPAPDERDRPVIGDRYKVVSWRAGGDAGCDVMLLLLPLTDMLRRLAAGRQRLETLSALDPVRLSCATRRATASARAISA
jgi:5-methylcytosine-specific restriction enzyme subunit McrC